MLNFNEEIKKFKPSLEVDHIEKDVHDHTIEDLLDIIKKTTQEQSDKE